MKRIVQFLIAALLLGSLTIQADPFKEWNWSPPTQYVNGSTIPPSDDLSYTLYCGNTQGGPYDLFSASLTKPPPDNMDMAPLVNDVPGVYYCVATATSSIYLSESDYSGEASFSVTGEALGFVPEPPVLSLQ